MLWIGVLERVIVFTPQPNVFRTFRPLSCLIWPKMCAENSFTTIVYLKLLHGLVIYLMVVNLFSHPCPNLNGGWSYVVYESLCLIFTYTWLFLYNIHLLKKIGNDNMQYIYHNCQTMTKIRKKPHYIIYICLCYKRKIMMVWSPFNKYSMSYNWNIDLDCYFDFDSNDPLMPLICTCIDSFSGICTIVTWSDNHSLCEVKPKVWILGSEFVCDTWPRCVIDIALY